MLGLVYDKYYVSGMIWDPSLRHLAVCASDESKVLPDRFRKMFLKNISTTCTGSCGRGLQYLFIKPESVYAMLYLHVHTSKLSTRIFKGKLLLFDDTLMNNIYYIVQVKKSCLTAFSVVYTLRKV